MKQCTSPYDARSETERQRHLARLGTRWQERPLSHEERLALVLATVERQAWWRGFSWGWFWGSWR
jgi:hypothetical protein